MLETDRALSSISRFTGLRQWSGSRKADFFSADEWKGTRLAVGRRSVYRFWPPKEKTLRKFTILYLSLAYTPH